MSKSEPKTNREIEQVNLDRQVRRADRDLKIFTLGACASALGLLLSYGYSLTSSQKASEEHKLTKDISSDSLRVYKDSLKFKL